MHNIWGNQNQNESRAEIEIRGRNKWSYNKWPEKINRRSAKKPQAFLLFIPSGIKINWLWGDMHQNFQPAWIFASLPPSGTGDLCSEVCWKQPFRQPFHLSAAWRTTHLQETSKLQFLGLQQEEGRGWHWPRPIFYVTWGGSCLQQLVGRCQYETGSQAEVGSPLPPQAALAHTKMWLRYKCNVYCWGS